jgi:uncharacterized protein YcfJ
VSEQGRVLTGVVLGAIAGGVMAFLVFTSRGRHALRRADAALDDVSHALGQFRSLVREVDGAVQEARTALAPDQPRHASGEFVRRN